jgi:hypothetical protein
MTVDRELSLDPDHSVFDTALYEKYLGMHKAAVAKQDAILKSFIITDFALALLVFGKNLTIPVIGIGLRDLPAAREALTVLSAFSFLMLSLTFLNVQLYHAIIEQFIIRRARPHMIDPDFITAADVYTELYLKAFRSKMNIFGNDFYDAGKGFQWFYSGLTFLLGLTMFSVLLLHVSLVSYAIWLSFELRWFSLLFATSVALMSIVAILVYACPSFPFTIPKSERKSPAR